MTLIFQFLSTLRGLQTVRTSILVGLLLTYILGIGHLSALSGKQKEHRSRFFVRLIYNAGARRELAHPAALSLGHNSVVTATGHSELRSAAEDGQRVVVSPIGDPEVEARLHVVPSALPSDAWQPLIITKCIEGMPEQFAPCLATRHNITSLEVSSIMSLAVTCRFVLSLLEFPKGMKSVHDVCMLWQVGMPLMHAN